MNNQFEFTVLYVNGKYYLYTLTLIDRFIYTDIKEYNGEKKNDR